MNFYIRRFLEVTEVDRASWHELYFNVIKKVQNCSVQTKTALTPFQLEDILNIIRSDKIRHFFDL